MKLFFHENQHWDSSRYHYAAEQMMLTFDREDFDGTVKRAMLACTHRADELGEALKDSIKKREE